MTERCQECGKLVEDWDERHVYEDCGTYHLQRAVDILGLERIKQFLSAFKKEG